ncbi:uncharacterized protein [Aegilops tauschii subsp. strangulata]|uniref:Disease resistance protein At4g27190-like leucine-rich repeats domain-containing protein n=2 Tax=Aegilops tauschii subsp. strangulata TaxID=200361 RepID=A0A453DGC7_AEGTS|nr:uncharacterized protein LOC109734152 [Aegilops tauschii subsp. strangulata]
MRRQRIYVDNIEEAVQQLIPYLEDTSSTAHKAIYFDGWDGLAASAVLRAIAEDPPPSLLKIFNKIIHIDCSRWKSRRALQRTIAQEVLPHRVMDIFDRQDEEDDFCGIDEGSRAEIGFIGREILQVLMAHRCLVVFHNGSNDMVNLSAFGVPQPEFFGTKILWSFRERLRLNPGISEKVDDSNLFLYAHNDELWNFLLKIEAREIVGYTNKLGEAVEECCLYLLSLNSQGGNIMDYDWATHASNYWVCDGIIKGDQDDEAWEVAAALHQQINIKDYSSNSLPTFGDELNTPLERWILSRYNSVLYPWSTSFFLAGTASRSDPPSRPLPNDTFHQSNMLRVLKLCRCTFCFSAPPFGCCRNLRFLGLDGCKDHRVEEDEKQDRPAMECFQSLWVLDICHTDWEFALSPEITEQIARNIREVHIKKGRIWQHSFTWRQLQNLHKLRVIEPTSPWGTGQNDEFTNMVKLEFLDLSGDSTIQALPSMSGATSLKILILDDCVKLESVGPEGLPPSLESFSLDCCTRGDQNNNAQISHISLAGCARLVNFKLRGSLPNLEELDLSGTLVKTLDLKDKVVQAPCLKQIILLGCLQLLAILWPKNGMPKHTVLRIDSLVCLVQAELLQAYATIMDIRFLQTLVLESNVEFCWKSSRFHLNLCVPCTNKVEEQSYKKTTIGSGGHIMGPPRLKSIIPNAYITYMDVVVDNMTIDDCYNSAPQFQPLGSHVEIGDGISFTRMESTQVVKAIIFVMDKTELLHAHDNSSISTVIPEHMMSMGGEKLIWKHLKSCHIVRCPKLHTIFNIIWGYNKFRELVNFWAADLPMAHCIWSRQRARDIEDPVSFAKLQSIHLSSCPRLTFVLQFSRLYTLRRLETLHIVFCGDLRQVFPVEPEILTSIATSYRKDVLGFPNLKHIYFHQLFKLEHICQAKMFAPKLETIRVRGCWGLKRLPSVGRDSRPIVDCEEDWWEALEWDGPEAGHDPSLFRPRHSAYYKKPLPRVSVLR